MARKLEIPEVGTFLRNADTGSLAQVIKEDGEICIKPDIPGTPVRYPISQIHKWVIQKKVDRVPRGSYARVAYEADRALCAIHPEFQRQKEWMSLDRKVRAAWIERRVSFKNVLRQNLFNVIIKHLEEGVEENEDNSSKPKGL